MPTKIASEGAFRLSTIVWTFVIVLGVGYLAGLVHGQAMTDTRPEPSRTVHVEPAP